MSSRTDLVRITSLLNKPGVLPKRHTALHKGMRVEVVRAWTTTVAVVTNSGARSPLRPGWSPVMPERKADWVESVVEQVGALAHRIAGEA